MEEEKHIRKESILTGRQWVVLYVSSMLCCGVSESNSSSIRSVLYNVVAVLDGGGVDKGGDLLVALSLLNHIDNVLKLVLLGDLLGLGLSSA